MIHPPTQHVRRESDQDPTGDHHLTNMTTGKGHKQATPKDIAALRARLEELDANGSNAMVVRYRWYLSDRVLHRFITARNGDIEVALKMILGHLVSPVVYHEHYV